MYREGPAEEIWWRRGREGGYCRLKESLQNSAKLKSGKYATTKHWKCRSYWDNMSSGEDNTDINIHTKHG